jgi:hypothetical protein
VGLAALALLVGVAGCGGGSSTSRTFTLPVQQGDSYGTLYTRAMTTAVQYCVDNSKLERVSWKFDKDDIDKPVVQEYTNPKKQPGPMSIPCAQVRDVDPSQLTSTSLPASGSTETTEDQGASSQDQDEGGRGAASSTTGTDTTAGGGSGAGTTSAPASSTTVKP